MYSYPYSSYIKIWQIKIEKEEWNKVRSNRIRERGQRMVQKMIDREEKQKIEEKQLKS